MSETKEKPAAKPQATVVDVSAFDYLVVACGYTSRLIWHYLGLNVEFAFKNKAGDDVQLSSDLTVTTGDGEETLAEHVKAYYHDYDDEPDYVDDPIIPLYIDDRVDVYRVTRDPTRPDVSKEKIAAEAQTVLDCCRDIKIRASIAFRCETLFNAFCIVENLIVLRHCACFGVVPYEMKLVTNKDGKRVLIMTFDTESG